MMVGTLAGTTPHLLDRIDRPAQGSEAGREFGRGFPQEMFNSAISSL